MKIYAPRLYRVFYFLVWYHNVACTLQEGSFVDDESYRKDDDGEEVLLILAIRRSTKKYFIPDYSKWVPVVR